MFPGLSINEEAVNFAFAGDHVNVIITGVDITNLGVGKCQNYGRVYYTTH